MFLKKYKNHKGSRFVKTTSFFGTKLCKKFFNITKNGINRKIFYKAHKVNNKIATKKYKIYKTTNPFLFFTNCNLTFLFFKKSYYSNNYFGVYEMANYLDFYKYKKTNKKFFNLNNKKQTIKSFVVLQLHWGFNFDFDLNLNFFNLNSTSKLGLFLPFVYFNLGSIVYSVFKNNKPVYAVSSGSYCVVSEKNYFKKTSTIRLPSGVSKVLNVFNFCSLGRSANIYSKYTVLGKASQTFKLKRVKQSVRGVAKNCVDHPNGGSSKVKKPFLSP